MTHRISAQKLKDTRYRFSTQQKTEINWKSNKKSCALVYIIYVVYMYNTSSRIQYFAFIYWLCASPIKKTKNSGKGPNQQNCFPAGKITRLELMIKLFSSYFPPHSQAPNAQTSRVSSVYGLTLKSGSTVCFLNEPIINRDPGSVLIIRAYVDFLLQYR